MVPVTVQQETTTLVPEIRNRQINVVRPVVPVPYAIPTPVPVPVTCQVNPRPSC